MRSQRFRSHVAVVPLAAAVLCAGEMSFAYAHGAALAASRHRTAASVARAPVGDAQGVLAALNDRRRERHLRALTLDPQLAQAAAVQARYLAGTGRLDHRGSDGSRVGQRVSRAGYRWSTVAENLAQSRTSSPRVVVEMWMNSRGHRENLLNRRCTQMGVAHVRDVWVLVLARPR